MTEFNLEQEKDPELVETEEEDSPVDFNFDLPEYDGSDFALPDDFEDEDEVEEEEDGEPE